MSENIGSEKCSNDSGHIAGLPAHMSRYIGETVTIFTSSGGESGSGFTGVLMKVNECFVRLLSRIGPPPGCSLGNACSNFNMPVNQPNSPCGISGGFANNRAGMNPGVYGNYNGAMTAGGWDSVPVYTVGSVTDIPVSAIVSFVHNAV
jgi:hypothetical protein